MTLPNANITPIPDTDPDAVPSLWNSRYTEIDENFDHLDDEIQDQAGNAVSADEAIKLAWWLNDSRMQLEQWTSEWSLHDPLSVAVAETGIVGGDDSVDVANTAGFVVGREYVVYDGTNMESFVVSEILTSTRLTASANFTHSYTTGAMAVGCQWDKSPNSAHAESGEICYFLPVNVGEDSGNKTIIVRREDNDCALRVYFKDTNHSTWTECTAGAGTEVETGVVDVRYTVPGEGDISLKFVCEAGSTASDMDIYLIGVLNLVSFQNVIYEDLTLYISATGNDSTGTGSISSPWSTVNKAFSALESKRIDEGVVVTIEIDDGTYSYAAAILANHKDGDKIAIKGKNVYQQAMSAIINTTGTVTTPSADGNLVQALIELDDVTNIEVDDYVLLRNVFTNIDVDDTVELVSGELRFARESISYANRAEPLELQGVFKVISVDSGSSRVGISAIYRMGTGIKGDISIPTGAYEGDVTVLKSILSFTGCGGINVDTGSLGNTSSHGLENLAIVSTNAFSDGYEYYEGGCGIFIAENGHVSIGENVGVAGWWVGFGAVNGASIAAKKLCATGCSRAAISAVLGGSIDCYNATVSGSMFGVSSNQSAAFNALSSVAVACYYGGIASNSSFGNMIFSAVLNCAVGMSSELSSEFHAQNVMVYQCVKGIQAMWSSSVGSGGATLGSVIKNCTTGLHAENSSFIQAHASNMTYTTNTADLSPAANTEGNILSYIKNS